MNEGINKSKQRTMTTWKTKSEMFYIIRQNFLYLYKLLSLLSLIFNEVKDKIHNTLEMSNVVYKLSFNGNDNGNFNNVYVGTTKDKLKSK